MTVSGECYAAGEVNYFLWGLANQLCHDAGIVSYGLIDDYSYTLDEAMDYVRAYRIAYAGVGTRGRIEWTCAGHNGWYSASQVRKSCRPNSQVYPGRLFGFFGNRSNSKEHFWEKVDGK